MPNPPVEKGVATWHACPHRAHRAFWRVVHRKCNHSAFNGRHRTPSAYSEVTCTAPDCHHRWRTKAEYVDSLPNL